MIQWLSSFLCAKGKEKIRGEPCEGVERMMGTRDQAQDISNRYDRRNEHIRIESAT